MSVAVLITDDWEVDACLAWTSRFAAASASGLTVLHVIESKSATAVTEVTRDDLDSSESAGKSNVLAAIFDFADRAAGADDNDTGKPRSGPAPTPAEGDVDAVVAGTVDDAVDGAVGDQPTSPAAFTVKQIPFTVKQIRSAEVATAVLSELKQTAAQLLLIPRHVTERRLDPATDWEQTVFTDAECGVMQIRPRLDGGRQSEIGLRILVPVDHRPPALAALGVAVELVRGRAGQVDAVYVAPPVDEVAELAGSRTLATILRGADLDLTSVRQHAVVADSIDEGIRRSATKDTDLILFGTAHTRSLSRSQQRSLSGAFLNEPDGPTVAIYRPPMPFSSRVRRVCERFLKDRVPQVDRQQRVKLVSRLQQSSAWDFDFIALICMSTLIAALGLSRDSAAVVIGAMLVAPLMTPLVAAGLSLVQSNWLLFRQSTDAVLKGFLLAIVIAFLFGWIVPGLEMTSEMRSRCAPSIFDLAVALASGAAAAYAQGRPNLYSALPGVAIAAALVPPIATSGMAASMGYWSLALGALLLFLTNIVAIALGTAVSLWAIGLRATHAHGRTKEWAWRATVGLVLITVVLAGYELLPESGVSRQLLTAVERRIERAEATHLVAAEMVGERGQRRLHITIFSPDRPAVGLRRDIRRIVQDHGLDGLNVSLETRLFESIE